MSNDFNDDLYGAEDEAQRVGSGPQTAPAPTKMDNVSAVMKGPKTGKVMLVTGGALLLVIGLVFVMFSASKKAPAQLPDDLRGANVGGVPGLKEQQTAALAQSQQYNDMVAVTEQQRAASALESGQSSQPMADTISKDLVPSMTPAQLEALALARAQEEAAKNPPVTVQQVQYAQPAPQPNQNDPVYQATVQNAQQAMAALLAPRARGVQTFMLVEAQPSAGQQAGGAQAQAQAAQAAAVGPAQSKQFTLISAGTVESARLETGVNTDVSGSFVATLVTGKYAGARLVGTTTRNNELAVLSVRTMSLPGQGVTVPVTAEVIDAGTREPGTATDVDRKLMAKYVIKPLAAGVAAVGQAVANAGTTVIVNGETTVSSQPTVDTKRAMQIAGGAAAEQVNSDASAINTTPTVRVAPGAIVGIVFTSDVLYSPKN